MKNNSTKKLITLLLVTLVASIGVYAFYISKDRGGKSIVVDASKQKDISSAQVNSDANHSATIHKNNNNDVRRGLDVDLASQIIIATTLIVLFSLFLYSKQKRLNSQLKSPHIITPQDFEAFIRRLGDRAEKLEHSSENSSREIHLLKTELLNSYQEMRETFLTMQKALDQRDSEIKRLQNGSEINITRKFLKRFAKIDQFIDQNIRAGNTPQLSQVSTLLRDALEESDVFIYEPDIGADYRDDKSITEKPIVFMTNDPAQFYKVKSVKSHGYRARIDSGAVINIIEPVVEVYAPAGEVK